MATGVITTGSHPRLLLPGISMLFGQFYNQLDAKHMEIFAKKMSKRNYEEAVQLVGVGQAEKKGEGEPIAIDSTKQGYARRTVHNVWHKAIKITMEAFEDNLYQDQSKILSKELAKALFHTKETNAAAILNNADSTSAPYVGADGKALLASDHPLGRGGSFSNLSTSDLSELALENAMIAIAGWVDNSNLLLNANVKSLVIPRQNRYTAHRILRSNLRAGTADNDANALKDMSDVPSIIEWRFLTDSDSWFLLTDQDGLCFYERKGQESRYFQEDTTLDNVYMMYERYSFDHYDPRAIYGSMGA